MLSAYDKREPYLFSWFHRCTLIELLVVLANVALSLTLAMPRYFQDIDSAKETILIENLQRTRTTIDRHLQDTGRYPDSLEDLMTRRYLKALPVGPVTERRDTWTVIAPDDLKLGGIFDLWSGAPG